MQKEAVRRIPPDVVDDARRTYRINSNPTHPHIISVEERTVASDKATCGACEKKFKKGDKALYIEHHVDKDNNPYHINRKHICFDDCKHKDGPVKEPENSAGGDTASGTSVRQQKERPCPYVIHGCEFKGNIDQVKMHLNPRQQEQKIQSGELTEAVPECYFNRFKDGSVRTAHCGECAEDFDSETVLEHIHGDASELSELKKRIQEIEDDDKEATKKLKSDDMSVSELKDHIDKDGGRFDDMIEQLKDMKEEDSGFKEKLASATQQENIKSKNIEAMDGCPTCDKPQEHLHRHKDFHLPDKDGKRAGQCNYCLQSSRLNEHTGGETKENTVGMCRECNKKHIPHYGQESFDSEMQVRDEVWDNPVNPDNPKSKKIGEEFEKGHAAARANHFLLGLNKGLQKSMREQIKNDPDFEPRDIDGSDLEEFHYNEISKHIKSTFLTEFHPETGEKNKDFIQDKISRDNVAKLVDSIDNDPMHPEDRLNQSIHALHTAELSKARQRIADHDARVSQQSSEAPKVANFKNIITEYDFGPFKQVIAQDGGGASGGGDGGSGGDGGASGGDSGGDASGGDSAPSGGDSGLSEGPHGEGKSTSHEETIGAERCPRCGSYSLYPINSGPIFMCQCGYHGSIKKKRKKRSNWFGQTTLPVEEAPLNVEQDTSPILPEMYENGEAMRPAPGTKNRIFNEVPRIAPLMNSPMTYVTASEAKEAAPTLIQNWGGPHMKYIRKINIPNGGICPLCKKHTPYLGLCNTCRDKLGMMSHHWWSEAQQGEDG